MSEAQIEAELYTATFADEQRREIIHDLATRADEALGALRGILKTNAKTLWTIAVQVIRTIGYPQNVTAIPELVDQVSDRNSPAWKETVQTLAEMEKQAVIPYFIQVIWDRGQTNLYWASAMEDLCSTLCSMDREYAIACGPIITYILGQDAIAGELDVSILLDVLEKIGNECAAYAIPTLIDFMYRDGRGNRALQARQLITSFNKEALEPYKYVLASLDISC